MTDASNPFFESGTAANQLAHAALDLCELLAFRGLLAVDPQLNQAVEQLLAVVGRRPARPLEPAGGAQRPVEAPELARWARAWRSQAGTALRASGGR